MTLQKPPYFRNTLLVVVLLCHICFLFSQSEDSTQNTSHFSGKILLTHNGISLVPSFSLDRPAVLFNLSLGKNRLTFEPDIRFSLLDAKPWSMLLWWRYKAVQTDRFKLRAGVHPGYNFRTIPVVSNGKSKDVIETRRFLAGEIVPGYAFSKNIQAGLYYLYSLGLDDSQRHTHFLVLNGSFSNIHLPKDISLGIFPGVYYLKMDDLDGFYLSSSIQLTRKGFPVSLEGIVNRIIQSEILPERKFVWNISLVFSFNKHYIALQPGI